MAIDPKELRIGSHVNVNGLRVRVGGVYKESIVVYTPNDAECENHVIDINRISSIPITPELLMEIGFEKHEVHGKDVFRRLYKDTPLGKMYYVVNYNPNAEAWNFCVHPTATEVKYLHELESMAYLATKQELIND